MEAEALQRGEPSRHLKLKGMMKWLYDVSQGLMNFEAMQVDEVVQVGQILPILGGLEVIASPGHTQEHISFYAREQGILFAGDSFRSNKNGLVTSTGVNTWDEEAAQASAVRQGKLEPQVVCVGHGPVVYDATGKFPPEFASLIRFKQHLQVLSVSAEEQLSLYPDFVVKADELALDFDHWYRVVFTNYKFGFSHEQKQAADKIDEYFSFMTNMKQSSLWTKEAVRSDPHWETVREMARETLEIFGWESEVPEGFQTSVYVQVKTSG